MQHSFKIHHKNTFLTPELTKSQYKPPMRSKLNRNLNFRDHTYFKFKKRRQPKLGLLNRKTMLQHYLSKSITLWSQQNDFFDAINRQKRPPQMSEVDQKLVVKLRFWEGIRPVTELRGMFLKFPEWVLLPREFQKFQMLKVNFWIRIPEK